MDTNLKNYNQDPMSKQIIVDPCKVIGSSKTNRSSVSDVSIYIHNFSPIKRKTFVHFTKECQVSHHEKLFRI